MGIDMHISITSCLQILEAYTVYYVVLLPLLNFYSGLVKFYMHFPLCIYHPPNAADRISESLTGALEQSIA